MRWHMHVVREAGLELAQAIGRGISALRMWRSFDSVDVKMIRERMAWVELQYCVQCRNDFVRTGIRLTFNCPLVPRLKVHHRFCKKRAYINVAWESLPDVAHGLRISLIERTPVLWLWERVAFAEGINQRSFYI